jgi:phage terminase large subunit
VEWLNPNANYISVDLADGFSVVRNAVSAGLSPEEGEIDFGKYENDPIGFGEELLGETYTDDVKALMLSVLENRDTLAKSANATGKSHAAARIALWFFLCKRDSQVYTAAAPPEDNLRKVLWAEIGRLVELHPRLFRGLTINDLFIKRHNKSFLTGVTIPTQGTEAQREGRFSGKHAPNLMFIFDEADAIPNECYRGAESCMSGGHARFLAMFNPRHESGILYQKEKKRVINVVGLTAFRHPNVSTGDDIYPGAVDRATTIRRIHEWTEPLLPHERHDAECFEVPDFLVGTTAISPAGQEYPPIQAGWRRIVEPSFSYMVLGEYPSVAEGQLVSRAWINYARSRWDGYVSEHGRTPPKTVKPILGLDVAEMGVDSNVLAMRYGGYVAPLESWTEMDTDQTADFAADHFLNAGGEFIAVDGTGVGAGIAPKMERVFGITSYSVKMNSKPSFEVEEGEFTHMRDQLWWMVREWLRHDRTAMLPPDEKLIEELVTPTYAITSGKIKIMKKDDMRALLGRSPDRAEALILTFYNEFIESHDPDSALGRVLLGN